MAARMSQPGQAKAFPGMPPGQLKSRQNQSQTPSERSTASYKLREAVPRASRERAEATKIEAETHTGWKNGELLVRGSLAKRRPSKVYRVFSIVRVFAESANPLKYCACQQKRRFGPVRSESSCPCYGTSKNYEKHRKPKPKSTPNRRKSLVGLARAALSLNFGRSRCFERAVRGGQARSKRPERANLSAQARPGMRAVPSWTSLRRVTSL